MAAEATTTNLRSRLWLAVLATVVLGATACGGDGLLLPSAGQPSKISVISGNGQSGVVGQALDQPLVVQVVDPENRPVAGVPVVFEPPPGVPGTDLAPNDTVPTGPDGMASVHYTLGTTAGQQTVSAHAVPVVPSAALSTAFTAAASPEAATTLSLGGGDAQTGEVSTALEDSLAVRALDRFGNGVAGVEVIWKAGGGGSVSPSKVTTGGDGRAATQRTLGNRPGSYTTTATAEALQGSPVAFSATAITPPSPQLVFVTPPSTHARAGVAFDQQPVLQLQDPVGAPIMQAGVAVTVQITSGGGTLGGRTTVRSGADGRVVFTDLSIRGEPGQRTLIFAATDFSPVSSDPIDVAAGPPLASRSTASVPDGTAGTATTISLRVQDEFGTPVEGAADAIVVSVAGANPSSGLGVTDKGGGSYSATYTPQRSGTDQVAIQVSGTPVPGSPFTSTVVPGASSAAKTTASVTLTHTLFYTIDVAIVVRDAEGNLVGHGGDAVEIAIDGGAPLSAVDNGDGTYRASFLTFTAEHSIAVTLQGTQISGSPYSTR
jgi:filamin/ABP280 repeat protein/Big-like domain-containing protein